jgi:hypothetical protein
MESAVLAGNDPFYRPLPRWAGRLLESADTGVQPRYMVSGLWQVAGSSGCSVQLQWRWPTSLLTAGRIDAWGMQAA